MLIKYYILLNINVYISKLCLVSIEIKSHYIDFVLAKH